MFLANYYMQNVWLGRTMHMPTIRRLILVVLILALIPAMALASSHLALDAFYEAAFAGEYGDTQRDAVIRWEKPIAFYAKGSYTDADMGVLARLLYDLSLHVPGLPELALTTREESANAIISFVPQEEMGAAVNEYKDGNVGFVWVNYDNYVIKSAKIAISTNTRQVKRSAVIREEVVNMLGLLNDITVTKDSIICQSGKTVTDLSDTDYAMLNYLYSKEIAPGVSLEKAKRVLEE